MTQAPPLERFLGAFDAEGGPVALLGITDGDLSQRAVREALRVRLAQVDDHPQAKSAGADEVRLALHVAAAQLADALPTPGVDRPADVERPRQPITPGTRIDPRRRTLQAVVAHSGGWNATARHRVAAVAHAMGITLHEAIAMLAAVPTNGAARVPTPVRVREMLAEPRDRLGATPLGRLLLLLTAFCALSSLVLAGAIVYVVSESGSRSSDPVDVSAGSAGVTTTVVPAPNAVTAPAPVLADTETLVRAFADAGAFAGAYATARTSWAELEPGAMEKIAFACAQSIVNSGGEMQPMLALVLHDFNAGTPAPSVFAAGVLRRLLEFGALTNASAMLVEELPVLDGAGISPIGQGAGGRLVTLARGSTVDLDAWGATASALQEQDPRAGSAALALVIDAVLRTPSALDESSTALLDRAVDLRSWSPDDGALLIAWWDDDEVTNDRVALLSEALERHGVLGLDRSIVMSAGASVADRRAARGVLAGVFGFDATGADEFTQAWAEAARTIDARTDSYPDDVSVLERAADFALLNAAAARHYEGDARGAQLLLERVTGSEEGGAGGSGGSGGSGGAGGSGGFDPSSLTSPTSTPDGIWATRYLSVRKDEDARLTLLGELRASGGVAGPADADVLARAAVVGSNLAVRRAAQDVVRASSDDPYVINGLLETVHDAASQPDVSDTLAFVIGEALPATGSSSWRTLAQRGLAERLAEVVMASPGRRVEAAERSVREAYTIRLRVLEGTDTPDDLTRNIDPLVDTLGSVGNERSGRRTLMDECASLWNAWYERASRVPEGGWAPRPLASIERRWRARSSYGTGVLQRFGLAQMGLVEIVGYQVSAERPSASSEVGVLIRALEEDWREAERVTEQIVLAERTLTRLWAVRMGVSIEEDAS